MFGVSKSAKMGFDNHIVLEVMDTGERITMRIGQDDNTELTKTTAAIILVKTIICILSDIHPVFMVASIVSSIHTAWELYKKI